MCLTVKKHSCIQTAKKDIVVYKILKISYDSYIAPYRETLYNPIGEVNKLDSQLKKIFDKDYDLNSNVFIEYHVNEGFHTFVNLNDAKNEAIEWTIAEVLSRFAVVKCIIPTGSKYYKGTCDILRAKNLPSIVSDKLILVEEIKIN